MSTTIIKTVTAWVTPVQFEEALALYSRADKRETEINNWIATETTRIKEKYIDELAWLQHKKNNAAAIVQTYCREQKETLFARKRSYATAYGKVGFRLCTPKLKTLKGHTWAGVLDQVKAILPEYIRTTEELAKDLLITDRASKKVAPLLEHIGVRVVQDEVFFIEVKKEETVSS